jgi:uncharacterized membrane protein YbhN (UPF0104 family)
VRERWWRPLQWVGALVILAFVARYLVRNWNAIRSEPIGWDFDPLLIAASVLVVLATYALLAEAWRRMLAGWGHPLSWLEAARIWVLSSMGKYIPGKLWALAGLALLAQRRGVSVWSATASAVLLQIVSLGTGALLVGVTGFTLLEVESPGISLGLVAIVLASVAALVLALRPGIVGRMLARFGVPADRLAPAPGAVGFGIAANLAAWTAYGAALWLLARGVLPAAELPLGQAIGAFAGSYLAGLLFLLAPGGLGVREGVFLWMLADRLGPANALALAVVSRLAMTAADLLAAIPFALTGREARREAN